MSLIHISVGGPDRVIVDEQGKRHKFEMHPRFGPILLTADGEVAKKQPGEKASFWRAVSWWAEQGQRIDDAGVCIWAKPPEPKLQHLGGRHYKVIG